MSKKILVTVPFTDKQKAALQNAADRFADTMLFTEDPAQINEAVADASGIIGNISPELLAGAGQLQWLQLNSAGTDLYVKPGVLPADTVLTCATGAYGTALSEYLVCMLLVMMKKIPLYLENQKQGVWKDEGDVASPAGKRILVVGTGDIGLAFARRIKAFGLPDHPVTIAGIRRRAGSCPAPLDEIHPISELKEQAARADIIVLSLPGTPETRHLFDRDLLLACKAGSYLMNIGRGNVIDTKALLDPTVSSHFAGIYLDVCEQEPLLNHSPLYSVPGLYITPHISGQYHLDITLENIADIALHNYLAFRGEGEYRSVVDIAAGYAK